MSPSCHSRWAWTRPLVPSGRLEAALALLTLTMLGLVSLFVRGAPVQLPWLLVPLAWIALRVGWLPMFGSVVALAACAAGMTLAGQGQFAGASLSVSLQRIGILTAGVPAGLLLVTTIARRAEARALHPDAWLLRPRPVLPLPDAGQLGLLAVVVTHIALFSSAHLELAGFNMDMDRDLTRTVELVTGQGYPFVGPALKTTSLSLGSLTYLIFALPVLISDDPLTVHLAVVMLGAGAITLVAVALRTVVRPAAAALGCAMLLATGPWFTGMLVAWHATLAPMAALCFWAGAARLLTGGGVAAAIVMCAGAAAAPQLHASMAPLLVLCLLALVAVHRRLGVARLAAAVAAGVLVSVPLLLGLLLGEGGSLETALAEAPVVRQLRPLELLSEAAWAFTPSWDTAPPAQLLSSGVAPAVLAAITAALIGAGIVRALRRERGLGLGRLATVGLVLGVPFALLLPTAITARYTYVIAIPAALLAPMGLDWCLRHSGSVGRWLPVALLALILAVGVRGTTMPHHGQGDVCGLMAQRQVARLLIDEAGIPYTDRYRMHGAICRRPETGFPYFLAQRPRDLARAADTRARNRHAALLPPAEPLDGRAVTSQRVVTVAGRPMRFIIFDEGPQLRPASGQPLIGDSRQAHFQLPVPVGRVALNLDVRVYTRTPHTGRPPRCAVVVREGSGLALPLSPVPGLMSASRLALRASLEGASPPLTVEVSSCPQFIDVDVY